jgi:hypothetical protein
MRAPARLASGCALVTIPRVPVTVDRCVVPCDGKAMLTSSLFFIASFSLQTLPRTSETYATAAATLVSNIWHDAQIVVVRPIQAQESDVYIL